MKSPDKNLRAGGFSLVETVFATGIVATFFVALFGLNTQCLYFVNASRELASAGQTAQTRLEQLRNCTWAQITKSNGSDIQTLLATPVTGASSLGTITEIVTVTGYPTAGTATVVTRTGTAAATVSPSTNATLASGDMVTINLELRWTAAPSARAHKIVVSTVYAKNTQ